MVLPIAFNLIYYKNVLTYCKLLINLVNISNTCNFKSIIYFLFRVWYSIEDLNIL